MEILNNLDRVEMGSMFYHSYAYVLSNPEKSVALLRMPPEVHLEWLTHLIELRLRSRHIC